MRTKSFVMLGLCVAGVIFWLVRPDAPKPAAQLSVAQEASAEPIPDPAPLLHTISPFEQLAPEPKGTTPIPMEARNDQPREIPQPQTETTIHARRDDFGFGKFTNTVAAESLQLTEQAFEGKISAIGTYTSGQFLGHSAFATIMATYKATVPADGSLQFEVRTMMSSGQWGDWQEMQPGDLSVPVEVEDKGYGWQYRFTFSAPSAASSPQVHNVTITTERGEQSPVGNGTSALARPNLQNVP